MEENEKVTYYLDLQYLKDTTYWSTIGEVGNDSRAVLNYIQSYLTKGAQTEEFVHKRYKLLDDTRRKNLLKLRIVGFKTELEIRSERYILVDFCELMDLYEKAAIEYEIYLRVKNTSTEQDNKDIEVYEEKIEASNKDSTLPIELRSERALKYLNRAVEAGYLDNNYKWVEAGHTRAQQTYLANIIGDALEISNKWQIFGSLWGFRRFAQTWNGINKEGLAVKNETELDKIIED